jgi:hypothetical protein
MTSSHVCKRILAASLFACGLGLSGAATASADPEDADQTDTPAPEVPAISRPVEGDATTPAAAACGQFARALRVSSAYYNDFAHSIAGEGAHVDYQDPMVRKNNEDGRTALQKAAGAALSASGTPGLQPEVAAPMRRWSMRAAKLLIVMAIRADGNMLNSAATELNTEASNAQMACANAGTHA